MEELTEQKCEACRVGAPSVTAEEFNGSCRSVRMADCH